MSKKRFIEYAIIVFLFLPLIAFAQLPETMVTMGPQEIQETKETQETQGTQPQETQVKQESKEMRQTRGQETQEKPETQGIKEYKVIKGDTLWGISKTYLNDPFMWPKIWKENPDIKNPRWIYPGQIVKVPVYLIQKEEAPPKSEPVSQEPLTETKEEKKEVQIKKYPIVKESLVIASGYIAETIPEIGQISDCCPSGQKVSDKNISGVGQVDEAPSGYTVHGNEDIVFINVNSPAKVGDKFYAINVSDPVYHPITGEKIGYVITIRGILEVIEVKDGDTLAKITKSFREIEEGDMLDSYYDIKSPMTTGDFRSPDINGMIVASADVTMVKAMDDIVYIDRGSKDGVEVGDMFKTIAVDAHAVPNGTIQVINCKDHTATAIIQSSISTIVPGNIFAKLEKIEKKTEKKPDTKVKKDQPAEGKDNTAGMENTAAKEAVH